MTFDSFSTKDDVFIADFYYIDFLLPLSSFYHFYREWENNVQDKQKLDFLAIPSLAIFSGANGGHVVNLVTVEYRQLGQNVKQIKVMNGGSVQKQLNINIIRLNGYVIVILGTNLHAQGELRSRLKVGL